MKVTAKMIDPELRPVGQCLRIVPNLLFTERGFRILHRMTRNRRTRSLKRSKEYLQEWITREDGSEMRLCIYRQGGLSRTVPGVLWLHGGGYAIGYPEQSEKMIRRLLETTGCVVIAPDYRLSVEAPYPAALQDAYQALLWMKGQASQLGIREDQLMIGGESAGAGLSAAVSLYARETGEVPLAYQMLIYPMLDDRMNSESARDNDAPLWNSQSSYIAWKLYLGDLFGKEDVPVYAAPARNKDFKGLPPACVYVGDLEPFRDETIAYVDNLRQAGIPVDFRLFPGCFHGFDIAWPQAKVSLEAAEFMKSAFAHAVKTYFSS